MQAACKEIVMKSKNRDVIKVGIIGEPHTGKSTQAETIAHIIHKMSKKLYNVDFAVRAFDKEAFVDIKKTLKELSPANYVLRFGDLSFLKSQYGHKKIEELEQAMTEIRHLEGGKDVKIIIVYDYHYTKALPPYLRQSDFNFFTGIGSSELVNMAELVGARYDGKIRNFKKLSDRAPSTEKFVFQLGGKGYFTYKYRSPFIPMLFWNQETLRTVVSPTRHWIDPICAICSMSDDDFKTEIDLAKLIEIGQRNFGEYNFEAAIKLKLHSTGVNVYGKNVVNATKWLDKIMEKKKVNLEDLAVKYEFKPTITKLRKSTAEITDN
jgi:energy-coupling factor transporter ATP-binding protein EcfA2